MWLRFRGGCEVGSWDGGDGDGEASCFGGVLEDRAVGECVWEILGVCGHYRVLSEGERFLGMWKTID